MTVIRVVNGQIDKDGFAPEESYIKPYQEEAPADGPTHYCSSCGWRGAKGNLAKDGSCPQCGDDMIVAYGSSSRDYKSNREKIDDKVDPALRYKVSCRKYVESYNGLATHAGKSFGDKQYLNDNFRDMKIPTETGLNGGLVVKVQYAISDIANGNRVVAYYPAGGEKDDAYWPPYVVRIPPPYWKPEELRTNDLVTMYADDATIHDIPLVNKNSDTFEKETASKHLTDAPDAIKKLDDLKYNKYKEALNKTVYRIVSVDDGVAAINGPFYIDRSEPKLRNTTPCAPIDGVTPKTYKVPLSSLRGVNRMLYPNMKSNIELNGKTMYNGSDVPYSYPMDLEEYKKQFLKDREVQIAKAQAEGLPTPRLGNYASVDIPRTYQEARARIDEMMYNDMVDILNKYLTARGSKQLKELNIEFPSIQRPAQDKGTSIEYVSRKFDKTMSLADMKDLIEEDNKAYDPDAAKQRVVQQDQELAGVAERVEAEKLREKGLATEEAGNAIDTKKVSPRTQEDPSTAYLDQNLRQQVIRLVTMMREYDKLHATYDEDTHLPVGKGIYENVIENILKKPKGEVQKYVNDLLGVMRGMVKQYASSSLPNAAARANISGASIVDAYHKVLIIQAESKELISRVSKLGIFPDLNEADVFNTAAMIRERAPHILNDMLKNIEDENLRNTLTSMNPIDAIENIKSRNIT